MDKRNIVIVGGGITGLSAAFYLEKHILQDNLPYNIHIVEASERLGGKIKTIKRDGYTIELGPDSLLARKPATEKIIKELGLENKAIHNSTGKSYLLVKNKLHLLPKGTFMGVPKDVRPLLSSRLISTTGKMRALLDLIKTKDMQNSDQSIGKFLRRRFGNEVVDKQISPLISGIHSGDIDEMSLQATYPMFYEMEQKYGSVMKGLQKSMPKSKRNKKKTQGMFISFEDGLETLPRTIVDHLHKTKVNKNCAVDHIEKKDNAYHVLLSNGEVIKASAVIVATEHQAVPRMFSQYDFFKTLYDIPNSSTANIVLAFDEKSIKNDIDGTGYQVSRISNDYRITACTWTNKKWPTTTPAGKVLLRCYVGKPTDQNIVDMSDEEITEIALNDIRKTLKIKGKPEFSIVTRWKNARPQYNVGHLDRVNDVREQIEAELPGVYLIGSSYDGAGIPDCMDHGEKAAVDVLEFLQMND